MRIFSDHEVLRIWEAGLQLHPIDRALAILATASPEADPSRLAALSVGQRDGRLMDVREANFGPGVSGVAECPGCEESLEWSLDLGDIRAAHNDDREIYRLTADDHELLYRLPNSTDLAAVASSGDVRSGKTTLLHRCVLEVWREGAPVESGSLPETVVSELAADMEVRDPQAETLLDFECPACGLRWQALFDVLEFLWAEVHARARRLLGEVRDLARAYGWSEEDILRMGATRRRFYLEAT